MDVWDDSSSGDGGLDESVELFVSSDSKMKMSWGDTLHLKILGGVTGQLEDFGGEIFEDGSAVYCGSSSDTSAGSGSLLQETMDTSDRELESSASTSRYDLRFGLSGVLSGLSFSSSHCELD